MEKIVLGVLVGSMFFAACTPKSATVTSGSPVPTLATSASPVASAVLDTNAKTFTVKGLNFSFDVKEIKVKKGDTVKIVFKNTEGFHDWRVDEFNAATKQIREGEEDTVTFVADKTGTFEYFCSVSKHRALGMTGKLIVE